MQVTREVVNGADHLITDYMYNNDNVGINLTLINGAKTNKVFNLSGVPIEYNAIAFNRAGDSVEIKAHLHYDENKKEIQTIADVKYPHETVTYTEIIKDEDFAHDIINVCLIERKNLNSMPCYKAAFDKILEQVKNVALEKDVFIRTD